MEIPFRASMGATVNRNNNTNKNITCDTEYYFKLFPSKEVLQLQVDRNTLQGKKRELKKHILPEERTEVMKAWIGNVKMCCSKIEILLGQHASKRDEQKMHFAAEVESLLKIVTSLNGQWDEWKQLIAQKVATVKLYNGQSPGSLKIFGLQSQLDEICGYIGGTTKSSVIGIFGACGIGKTTFLTEIEKKFRDNDGNPISPFTKVILVGVEKVPDLDSIQGKLVVKLKLGKDGNGIDAGNRALVLSEALSRETFLILLDDLRENFDFERIGIPPPNKRKCGSKIVITTRNKRVFAGACLTERVDMKYLNESDSFSLFTYARGDEPIRKEDEKYAKKIVEKCAGLPLALMTLGKGTIGRDLRHICECLSNSPKDIFEMETNLLLKLKESFDELEDDAKHCFLFCVLFQDFKNIDRKRLVEYWIGENLLYGGFAELRRKANDIITQLVNNWLIKEAPDIAHLKMPSILRSMAVWLAKEGADDKHRFTFYVGEEFDQSHIEIMKLVKRVSLIDTDTDRNKVLKSIPKFEKMSTLLMGFSDNQLPMHWEKTACIENSCFSKGKMPSIRVLDMAYQPITKLPINVCYLKSLQYLNLSYTFIEKLPLQLRELTTLKQLDLTGTKRLQDIPSQAISNLVNLKSLNLYDSEYCKMNWKGQLQLKDLNTMNWLAELQLSVQNLGTFKSLSEFTKLANLTTSLQLSFITFENSNLLFEILQKFMNLEMLSISGLNSIEDRMSTLSLKDRGIKILCNSVPKLKTLVVRDLSFLSQLSIISASHVQLYKLQISNCSNLESIACLCHLQSLEILEIEVCQKMVELLPLRCETTAATHQDHIRYLPNLKSLKLDCLPELISISHCDIAFKCMEAIEISRCTSLKKLCVNPTNEGREIKIYCEDTWWNALKWKDGVRDPSFHPSFSVVH